MILRCFGWMVFFLLKKIRVIERKDLFAEAAGKDHAIMKSFNRRRIKNRGYTGVVCSEADGGSCYTLYLNGSETTNKYSLYASGQLKSLQISLYPFLLYSQTYFINGCLKDEAYEVSGRGMKYFINLYLPSGRSYFKGYEAIVLVGDSPQVLLYDCASKLVTGRVFYLNEEGCVISTRLYDKGVYQCR